MTDASALPAADLSAAFTLPSRAAGLQGLAPRRRPIATPIVPVEPAEPVQRNSPRVTPADPPVSTTAGQQSPTVPHARAGRRTAPHADRPVRSVTVYVSPEVRDQLVAERDSSRAHRLTTTTTDIVLSAIDAAAPTLTDLLTGRSARRDQPNPGLFANRGTPRARTDTVQLGMRIDAGDLAVIDDLAHQHDINRSRLVSLCLQQRYTPSATSTG